jgi:hypothetical protein
MPQREVRRYDSLIKDSRMQMRRRPEFSKTGCCQCDDSGGTFRIRSSNDRAPLMDNKGHDRHEIQ